MAGNTRRERTRPPSGGKQPRSSARAGYRTRGPIRRARERAVAFHPSRSRSTTIHFHIRGRLRSAEALDVSADPAAFASRYVEVVRRPPGEQRRAFHRKNSSRARRAIRLPKDRGTFARSSKKILIHTAKTSARWLPAGHQNALRQMLSGNLFRDCFRVICEATRCSICRDPESGSPDRVISTLASSP